MEASCGFNLNYFIVGMLIGFALTRLVLIVMARPKRKREEKK